MSNNTKKALYIGIPLGVILTTLLLTASLPHIPETTTQLPGFEYVFGFCISVVVFWMTITFGENWAFIFDGESNPNQFGFLMTLFLCMGGSFFLYFILAPMTEFALFISLTLLTIGMLISAVFWRKITFGGYQT